MIIKWNEHVFLNPSQQVLIINTLYTYKKEYHISLSHNITAQSKKEVKPPLAYKREQNDLPSISNTATQEQVWLNNTLYYM